MKKRTTFKRRERSAGQPDLALSIRFIKSARVVDPFPEAEVLERAAELTARGYTRERMAEQMSRYGNAEREALLEKMFPSKG